MARGSNPGRGWTRRRFLRAAAFTTVAPRLLAAEEKVVTPTAAFDPAVEKFMEERGIPGGVLAVAKDGRLVHARGFGWADRDEKVPVTADSLFRIASVAKPFTAAAVLKLVEEGKLTLDARAFDLVPLDAVVPEGKKRDARLAKITIRHLLHHTSGWDRDKSYDPMFRARLIAEAVGEPPPASAKAVIRYMLGQPLDFDPGARYAYSNFGYCVLGRVIENVTEQSYEKCVQEKVLGPAGIRQMRLGATREAQRAGGEVRYYTRTDATAKSVFDDGPVRVPVPYGGFHLEAMDAHGGWIASAVDLVRFASALGASAPKPLLKAETWKLLWAAPAAPVSRLADGSLPDSWYGCGWQVRPVGKRGRFNLWHTGSLPGTYTLLVRRADGLSYAALFNQRSEDWKKGDEAIDPILARAAATVTVWPTEDQFPKWS